MAYRTVRFAPLAGDGVGDPTVTRGVIRWAAARREAYGNAGEVQPSKWRTMTFSGAALTDDLPVGIPVRVNGFFDDPIDLKHPTWTDYVRVDAGGTTVDYEDKVVEDSGIVLLDPSSLDLTLPMSSEDKAALDELRADFDSHVDGSPTGTFEAADIADATEPGLTVLTVTGATLTDRQLAAREALAAAPEGTGTDGSITVDDLDITGTPTGAKFLRDDGSWSTPTGVVAGSVDWADITGAPSVFPPDTHTHAVTDITGEAAAVGTFLAAADATAARAAISATEYPTGGSNGQALVKSGTTVAWSATVGSTIATMPAGYTHTVDEVAGGYTRATARTDVFVRFRGFSDPKLTADNWEVGDEWLRPE